MRKLSLSFALALAAGCGGADSHSGMLIDPGPAPANGMQIILPIQKGIKAGSDNELCTWTDVTVDKTIFIKAIQGFQSETGHHIVVYKTKTYEPAGTTRPCSDDDMASFRYVGAAGGEGITIKNIAPGNLAFVVEKGYQIVVNEHFLNASPTDHDGQSAVNLEYVDPGMTPVPSGAFSVLDTKLKVPTGPSIVDIEAELTRDFKVWQAIPHMHRWGTHIKIEHTPRGGTATSLFDIKWDDKYTFEPPELRAEPDKPLLFQKGDKIRVSCSYNNDTGKPLGFGPEMCVFSTQTIDDVGQGNWAWEGREWVDY